MTKGAFILFLIDAVLLDRFLNFVLLAVEFQRVNVVMKWPSNDGAPSRDFSGLEANIFSLFI